MDIVFDIGGTKIRAGVVSESGKLLETALFFTNKDYQTGIQNLISYIRGKDVKFGKICIGLPGVLDIEKKELYSAPNLKNWIKKPIKKTLEEEFRADVFLENDAALAGLGEAVFGAGKDFNIVSYLTISTGVGGVRIVNKRIDERMFGFEPGQHILCHPRAVPFRSQRRRRENGNLYKKSDCARNNLAVQQFSNFKTFESFTSGKSIKKIYGTLPENITDENIWRGIIKNIAAGIANTCFFWSPEAIVLGGGVTHSEYFDTSLLKKEVKKILEKTYPGIPEIKKSSLGDFSGIWGGVAYLENFL